MAVVHLNYIHEFIVNKCTHLVFTPRNFCFNEKQFYWSTKIIGMFQSV